MKLHIPDTDRPILARLAEADEEQVEKVIVALERARPALRPGALAEEVAAQAGVSQEEATDFLFVFFNLASTATRFREQTTTILAAAVLGEVADAEKKQRFVQRIDRILASRSVQITAKALSILLGDSNTYCEARTMSQIRPVFGEETMEPEAAIIVHQFSITYHCGADSELRDISVSMDRAQIEELRGVLERALKKDAKLAIAADKLGLPLLVREEL